MTSLTGVIAGNPPAAEHAEQDEFILCAQISTLRYPVRELQCCSASYYRASWILVDAHEHYQRIITEAWPNAAS